MNIALILAGGQGTRMKTDKPKQMLELLGKPMLYYSMEAFDRHPQIDCIYVVCADETRKLAEQYKFGDSTKFKGCIDAGETRKQSSQNGITTLFNQYHTDDLVLIHDAARPLISEGIISRNIETATRYSACTTVIPMTDTVLVSQDGDNITAVTDRATLFFAQTPQTFQLGLIMSVIEDASEDMTDDTSLLLNRGMAVQMVEGERSNIKLTNEADFVMAQALLSQEKHG